MPRRSSERVTLDLPEGLVERLQETERETGVSPGDLLSALAIEWMRAEHPKGGAERLLGTLERYKAGDMDVPIFRHQCNNGPRALKSNTPQRASAPSTP